MTPAEQSVIDHSLAVYAATDSGPVTDTYVSRVHRAEADWGAAVRTLIAERSLPVADAPAPAYKPAGGIEWCSTHSGIRDEIGTNRDGRCDNYDGTGDCFIHEVWFTTAVIETVISDDQGDNPGAADGGS